MRADVLDLINAELERAEEKHGVCYDLPYLPSNVTVRKCKNSVNFLKKQSKKIGYQQNWLDVLAKEVYEAFAEEEPNKQIEELVQVAATAVKIIEVLTWRQEHDA